MSQFSWLLFGKRLKCQVQRMTWKSNMKSKSRFIYLKRVLYLYRATKTCLPNYTFQYAIYEKYLILTKKKANNILYTYVKQFLFHLDLSVRQYSVKKMLENGFIPVLPLVYIKLVKGRIFSWKNRCLLRQWIDVWNHNWTKQFAKCFHAF